MTTTALTFKQCTFKRQKHFLLTLIEGNLQRYQYENRSVDYRSAKDFESKFFNYLLAIQLVWDPDSIQHTYFFNLHMFLKNYDLSANDSFFIDFLTLLLKEAKK